MIEDPTITAIKRRELLKRRKEEGKKYKLQVDYTIRMRDDKEFELLAVDLDDALDQIYAEIADEHNVEENDIEVEEPEVISIGDVATTPKPALVCPSCSSPSPSSR